MTTTPTKAENPSAWHRLARVTVFTASAWLLVVALIATAAVIHGQLTWKAIPIIVVPEIVVAGAALLAQRSKP